MAKILLISANAVFAGDLKSQLERHPDWEVREEYDSDGVFDAAVVDDDAEKLRSLHEKLLQTPLFLLWSGETELPEDEGVRVVRKPFRLEALIDALHTAVNAAPPAGGVRLPAQCCRSGSLLSRRPGADQADRAGNGNSEISVQGRRQDRRQGRITGGSVGL